LSIALKDFDLLENEFIGEGFCSLFHEPTFFHLHNNGSGKYFEWSEKAKIRGCIHFIEDSESCWRSPLKGTYAGFVHDNLSIIELEEFYEAVEDRLKFHGARKVEILLPPVAHDVQSCTNQLYILRKNNFKITKFDLNYSLNIDNKRFEELISYGNRKRVKKCERFNLLCERLELNELRNVYDTIYQNRKSKGYPMTMSFAEVEKMAKLFPENILLFGVKDINKIIASAFCLMVNPSTLYVLYWGELIEYSSYSPVAIIAKSIYEFCQANQINTFDIGTSSINLEPNYGLIRFKRNLGFSESAKFTLTKEL
jgi:hypothetical protein